MSQFPNEDIRVILESHGPVELEYQIQEAVETGIKCISVKIFCFGKEVRCIPVDSECSRNGDMGLPLESLLLNTDILFHLIIYDGRDRVTERLTALLHRLNCTSRVVVTVNNASQRYLLAEKDIASTLTAFQVVIYYFLYKTGLLFLKKSSSCSIILIPEKLGGSYLISRGFIRELFKRSLSVYVYYRETMDVAKMYDMGVNGFIVLSAKTAGTIYKKIRETDPG